MADITPFTTVIKALLDENTAFPARYLNHFSDIDPDHLKGLKEAWPQISITRKQSLLEDLENLLDKDTLLSFYDLAVSLINDPDAEVRTPAIRLLWECDDIKLVPTLLRILNSDPSSLTSAAAATALGLFIYLGELEEIPPQILKKVEDNLLEAAHSNSDSLVRRRAIEALGASSRLEVPDLIKSAYSSTDPQWIASALFAMGRSSDQSWERKIIARFHHEEDLVRLEAIQASGELALEAARSPLLRLLEDEEEDSDIHRAILWSLSQIGGEDVREKLEELLETTPIPEIEDFLEEVMENLNLTNEMASFKLLDLDGDGLDNGLELAE
jgi:HEAT repeat protein